MNWITRPRSRLGPLAAITKGAGPTVVLVHGVGLCADAWGAQIDALASVARLVALDVPGHGQSPVLPDSPQLADYSNAIAGALDGPAVVIGHSFGAMIAMDIAIRYPKKVRAVAALNAIYQRDTAAKTLVMARASGLDGVRVADPAGPLQRWFGADASIARDACQRWLTDVNPRGYRDAYRVFATQDGPAMGDLKTLACQALFMTGAAEPNSTPAMSKKMAALAPLGQAEIIADAAHMMPMTHAQQVNAILTSFVRDYAR